MLLWRLLLLPFFVQFEIRVELEANASHGVVRGREDVAVQSASDATRVRAFSVDRWRLLLLPSFMQFEIRVEL